MKALDIRRALVQVASIPIKASIPVPQDLLITLALLPDTAVGRSTVDREDLKPYWKLECSTVSRIFIGKTLAIVNELSRYSLTAETNEFNSYLVTAKTKDKWLSISRKFQVRWNLPNGLRERNG